MQDAGMKMNIKQVDEATLINDAIDGKYQASAWRNHPGFDPDTQWVWWHCTMAPGRVRRHDTSKEIGTDDAGRRDRQQLRQPGELQPVQRQGHQQGVRDGPRASDDPAVRKTAYEDINKEFAKQVWEGWGYWTLWTVPSQTNVKGIARTEPADRDVTRRRHGGRQLRSPVCRAGSTSRECG